MTRDERVIIEEIISDACVGLFADYDVEFSPYVGTVVPSFPEVAGIIGFSSDEFRGSVLIGAPTKTLLACSCVQGIEIDPLDWVGEIANQLLGRIKTSLLSYGVSVQLATPVSVQGGELRFHTQEHGELWSLVFATPFGEAIIRLAAECGAGFQLDASSSVDRVSAAEGELMFF